MKAKKAKSKITSDEFNRYLQIQYGGQYNMLVQARLAAIKAGLDMDTYMAIIDNYDYLCKKYPKTVEGFEKYENHSRRQ